MARSNAGRPRSEVAEDDSHAINRWFDQNVDRLTDLTDEQIATQLGYARPNIISMWRTSRTRIPLNQLAKLAVILKTDMATLLPLWLEQYLDEEDRAEIVRAAGRLCSESEGAFLAAARKVTGHRRFKLKKGHEKQLLALLDVE